MEPLVCSSLVYFVYEVHELNIRLCYEWEQLNVELAAKLTLNCGDRLVILQETVISKHSALSFSVMVSTEKEKKKNIKTPWTKWYLSDICLDPWG